jgi:hypothetical protein
MLGSFYFVSASVLLDQARHAPPSLVFSGDGGARLSIVSGFSLRVSATTPPLGAEP